MIALLLFHCKHVRCVMCCRNVRHFVDGNISIKGILTWVLLSHCWRSLQIVAGWYRTTLYYTKSLHVLWWCCWWTLTSSALFIWFLVAVESCGRWFDEMWPFRNLMSHNHHHTSSTANSEYWWILSYWRPSIMDIILHPQPKNLLVLRWHVTSTLGESPCVCRDERLAAGPVTGTWRIWRSRGHPWHGALWRDVGWRWRFGVQFQHLEAMGITLRCYIPMIVESFGRIQNS